jgi:hypothetical protein
MMGVLTWMFGGTLWSNEGKRSRLGSFEPLYGDTDLWNVRGSGVWVMVVVMFVVA